MSFTVTPCLFARSLNASALLTRILRVANALVREVRESNVGRHGASPLLCAAAFYRWLPPASLGRHNRAQLCAGHCCGCFFAFTREPTHSAPPRRGESTDLPSAIGKPPPAISAARSPSSRTAARPKSSLGHRATGPHARMPANTTSQEDASPGPSPDLSATWRQPARPSGVGGTMQGSQHSAVRDCLLVHCIIGSRHCMDLRRVTCRTTRRPSQIMLG